VQNLAWRRHTIIRSITVAAGLLHLAQGLVHSGYPKACLCTQLKHQNRIYFVISLYSQDMSQHATSHTKHRQGTQVARRPHCLTKPKPTQGKQHKDMSQGHRAQNTGSPGPLTHKSPSS
jgi:hypothetical protein